MIGNGPRTGSCCCRQGRRFEGERDSELVDARRRAAQQHIAAAEVRADTVGETIGLGSRGVRRKRGRQRFRIERRRVLPVRDRRV